jgi:hypothetical protein
MIVFVAKPNTWFKQGTEAKLIEYLHDDMNGVKYGLFEGIKERDGKLMTEAEVCSYEDFDIIEL